MLAINGGAFASGTQAGARSEGPMSDQREWSPATARAALAEWRWRRRGADSERVRRQGRVAAICNQPFF
jgi:hypothetical protein